jgi:hypothetical protein
LEVALAGRSTDGACSKYNGILEVVEDFGPLMKSELGLFAGFVELKKIHNRTIKFPTTR